MHKAQKITENDTINFNDGLSLIQKKYEFIDNESMVYKYNTVDNVQQDEFMKVLYRDYLKIFRKYNTNTSVILDEKLYNEIVDFMIMLRQHNEIEAKIVSYNVAVQDVKKRKKYIEQKIANTYREMQIERKR